MRMVLLLVVSAIAGCVDAAEPLPRCAEMASCGAAILGPGDNLVACGDGSEIDAVCAAPRGPTDTTPVRTACRVAMQDTCVCRFGADGVVTALCYGAKLAPYP